tara:strand:- start:98 stop:859 length:762 start_codon:yes stop_codon:yes gene_type:complete
MPVVKGLAENYFYTPLAVCPYEIGVKFEGAKTIEEMHTVLNRYWENDLKYEIVAEQNFEALTRAQIRGDYTVQDLELTKEFFEKTYGRHDVGNYAESIIFLPEGAKLQRINAQETKCASMTAGGIAGIGIGKSKYPIGLHPNMMLSSSHNMSKSRFFSLIAHEFAHIIHFKVESEYPQFNEQWDKIKGGYARKYGTNNRYEDVATVVEAAVSGYIKGWPLRMIKPRDRNLGAFQAKLRLLKQYNFLPPALEVR